MEFNCAQSGDWESSSSCLITAWRCKGGHYADGGQTGCRYYHWPKVSLGLICCGSNIFSYFPSSGHSLLFPFGSLMLDSSITKRLHYFKLLFFHSLCKIQRKMKASILHVSISNILFPQGVAMSEAPPTWSVPTFPLSTLSPSPTNSLTSILVHSIDLFHWWSLPNALSLNFRAPHSTTQQFTPFDVAPLLNLPYMLSLLLPF